MLADHRKAPIMAACVDVRWKTREGMGCLLPGRLILTAAHVVKYTPSGDKVYIHHIGTTEGTFGVQPVVIEPMADVAVLSALDDLKFPEEAKAFNSWCDQTPPLHLCTQELPLWTAIPIAMYTHKVTWQEGSAHQLLPYAPQLVLTMPKRIPHGTSGSPLLAHDGSVLGVVTTDVTAPRPHLTLPVWVMRRIRRAAAAATKDADNYPPKAIGAHPAPQRSLGT